MSSSCVCGAAARLIAWRSAMYFAVSTVTGKRWMLMLTYTPRSHRGTDTCTVFSRSVGQPTATTARDPRNAEFADSFHRPLPTALDSTSITELHHRVTSEVSDKALTISTGRHRVSLRAVGGVFVLFMAKRPSSFALVAFCSLFISDEYSTARQRKP
jgi:hypothetical protein